MQFPRSRSYFRRFRMSNLNQSTFRFLPSAVLNSIMGDGIDGPSRYADGLQHYDIHREIGRGAKSAVYLATCKKGRMRNREVALKKIPHTNGESCGNPTHDNSTSLHRALFHPSIVSLFSSFFTSSAQYQVLELCPNGTLQSLLHSRSPPVLSEAELRGVAKALVAALTYLRKSLVIHGDIQPSNVLLGEDCRIKLANFQLALQTSSPASQVTTFCGSPNFVSPEIINNSLYSFETDLWSLGALMVTCLSGIPAFEAPTTEQIFTNIIQGAYTLPDTVSYEARDLVSGLLQQGPAHRIPLHRILSHPFFNPSLPVSLLSYDATPVPTPPAIALSSKPSPYLHGPNALANVVGTVGHKRPINLNTWRSADTSPLKPGRRFVSDPTSGSRTTASSFPGRVRSVSSYTVLREENATFKANTLRPVGSVNSLASGSETLRIPSGSATPALVVDSGISDSGFDSDSDSGRSCVTSDVAPYPVRRHPASNYERRKPLQYATDLATHPLLRPPGLLAHKTASRDKTPEEVRDNPPHSGRVGASREPNSTPLDGSFTLNTSHLTPRTHKVSNGSLTVLPSRSLLVDFREGERRKGRKGNEVMLISPDGLSIKVYAAPHLSTPCCLAEPVAEYKLRSLPRSYQKQYADAAKMVDKLKRRIPKLILYEPEAQYTLMANGPYGDVEIIVPRPDPSHAKPSRENSTASDPGSENSVSPTTQIRLLRTHRAIEISQCSSRGRERAVGEWTKRVVPTLGSGYHVKIPEEEAARLDGKARRLLEMLYRFLNVCEASEKTRIATAGHAYHPPDDSPPPASDFAKGDDREYAPSSRESSATPVIRRVQSPPTCTESDSDIPSNTARKIPFIKPKRPLNDTSNISEPTGTSLHATCATASSSSLTVQLGNIRVGPRPSKLRSASSTSSVAWRAGK